MSTNPAAGARPSIVTERTRPMSVANMTFMVDRLGSDCAPGQFIRELTENSIAGIEALSQPKGQIVWDADWTTHTLVGRYKLCVIDDGIGMTGPELVEYINKLSSSVHVQSNTSNFGVGAKISAAPHNHEGVVYLSWKDGLGSMVHLWRDPATNVYGLKLLERPDGTYDHWAPIEDSVRPKQITRHGTMVVLLGQEPDQNTLEAPPGMPMPAKWILRYLNGRYFRFPDGVSVRVREGHTLPVDDKHNFLRTVEGMGAWLHKSSEAHGELGLTGAKARWWILRTDADVNSGHFTPPGHVAALYQDELYDLTAGRAGVAKLQAFGVIFGFPRVVVYIEPDAVAHRVETNTARTTLLLNGEPLPWSEWASEFRDKLPGPLEALVEEVGKKSASSDHRQAIRERLKSILDLFKMSRYRPAKNGDITVDPRSSIGGGGPQRSGRGDGDGNGKPGGRGGRGGTIYNLFIAAAGHQAEEIGGVGEPKTTWVTVADGTRSPLDMADRAAKYIAAQNLLMINGDFRGFTDMISHWSAKYSHAPGATPVVKEVVREWFEQQLVEAVVGAQGLKGSHEWAMDDMEKFWSPEALTAVVIPRYHVNLAITRALGSRLGSLRDK